MVRWCLTILALAMAQPAFAQQLTLEIRDGLVTLSATNVPPSQVLAEWARVGGTRLVGAERVSGTPLTLSLEGVTEAKALDIILRGAAGYVAAARPASLPGRSMYDRILVLATSEPPAASAAAASASRPGARGFGLPPAVEPVDQPEVVAEAEMPDVNGQLQTNPFANAVAQPEAPTLLGHEGPSIPFGQPTPQPGQPFLQDRNFFNQLPPADGPDPSLPGAGQTVRPRPQG